MYNISCYAFKIFWCGFLNLGPTFFSDTFYSRHLGFITTPLNTVIYVTHHNIDVLRFAGF
jgi:hypothetical protein